MLKQEFLDALKKRLAGLPSSDRDERLDFYREMIDDRMEEGLAEEQAVAEIGSVEEVVAQIISETPISKIAGERVRPKRGLAGWEITLLALGAPLWLSLAVAALAVVLSLYAAALAVVVSVWAVFAALVGTSLGALVAGAALTLGGVPLLGVALVGAGSLCAGLAVFSFFGCRAATRGMVLLSKKAVLGVKKGLIEGGKHDG